jgi:hypothetical protein
MSPDSRRFVPDSGKVRRIGRIPATFAGICISQILKKYFYIIFYQYFLFCE